jgi:DNA-directed RNA polymerase specialized sigma24 family protein
MSMHPVSDLANPTPMADETPEQLRARLLRCPKVRASAQKIGRSQGVADSDLDDVCQETLLGAAKATLPSTEVEARKYINGIAKFVAIDHVRKKREEPVESLEAMGRAERPVRERIEQRAFMRNLFEQGHKKFGRAFEWFVLSKVHKETSHEIGAAAGVTPDHVRVQVSLVSRWFDGAWGQRTGIGSVLALLLAVGAGWGWWMTHGGRGVDESQVSTYAAVRTDARPAMSADMLRERGLKACDEGAWSACEHDLAAARAMDPAGTTGELQVRETVAYARMMRFDADGDPRGNPGGNGDGEEGGELNAKPGR